MRYIHCIYFSRTPQANLSRLSASSALRTASEIRLEHQANIRMNERLCSVNVDESGPTESARNGRSKREIERGKNEHCLLPKYPIYYIYICYGEHIAIVRWCVCARTTCAGIRLRRTVRTAQLCLVFTCVHKYVGKFDISMMVSNSASIVYM